MPKRNNYINSKSNQVDFYKFNFHYSNGILKDQKLKRKREV